MKSCTPTIVVIRKSSFSEEALQWPEKRRENTFCIFFFSTIFYSMMLISKCGGQFHIVEISNNNKAAFFLPEQLSPEAVY